MKTSGGRLGLDGKCSNIDFVQGLKVKGIEIVDTDLVSPIWTDRPNMSKSAVFELEEKYAGKSRTEKLEELKKKLNSNVHIVTALDEICWLLNIRANDIDHTPVALSYLIIEADKTSLFISPKNLMLNLTTSWWGRRYSYILL